MRRVWRNNGLIAFLSAISLCIYVSPAMAVNLIAKPSITLGESWDSNIFNTSDNTVSDYIFRARPKLTLTVETREAKLDLVGGFELERYSKHDELDTTTATKNFDLSGTPLRMTPRFSVLPSARFVETKDSVNRIILTQDPIPDLPPSETTITVRTKTREYSGALKLIYLFSPNVDLGLGGGITKREHPEDPVGFADSKTLRGNASIGYRFTPRFSSGVFFGTSYNTYDDNRSSRTFSPKLTASYRLAEHYTLEGRAGATYTKKEDEAGADPESDKWRPSGNISLIYSWMEFLGALHGSYDVDGIGSFGVATQRGDIRLTLTDHFAPSWWWDLSGLYQINRSLDSPRTLDVSTWRGYGAIRYRVARWATLRLAGSLVRQRVHTGIEVADVDRHNITLNIELSDAYQLF